MPDIQIEVEDSVTIDALKATLAQKTGLPAISMVLLFDGQLLDTGTVSSNKILHEGHITVAEAFICG